MKELLRKDWDYILYESKKGLILSVLAGTVAVFEVKVLLNDAEQAQYKADGTTYLTALAAEIRSNPKPYQDRGLEA